MQQDILLFNKHQLFSSDIIRMWKCLAIKLFIFAWYLLICQKSVQLEQVFCGSIEECNKHCFDFKWIFSLEVNFFTSIPLYLRIILKTPYSKESISENLDNFQQLKWCICNMHFSLWNLNNSTWKKKFHLLMNDRIFQLF